MDRVEILLTVLAVAMLAGLIFPVANRWNNERWDDAMKEVGYHYLNDVKGNGQEMIRGELAQISYRIDKYEEAVKVVVPSKDREIIVRDLNKSRIMGEWAGEKSEEFLKGFFEGQKKESKFPD